MTRILRYSLIAATVTILLAQGGTALADAVEPVSVFLVRHAEKAADDPQDPQLSVNGKQRASELARILSNAGVTHLFSSQSRRTKSTLQPLAEKTGGEIVIIRAQQSADQVEALRDLPPGSVAVVAGHSNTIPALVCALAGAAPDLDCSDSSPTLAKEEYDRLYVVILPPAGTGESVAATTLSLRY